MSADWKWMEAHSARALADIQKFYGPQWLADVGNRLRADADRIANMMSTFTIDLPVHDMVVPEAPPLFRPPTLSLTPAPRRRSIVRKEVTTQPAFIRSK